MMQWLMLRLQAESETRLEQIKFIESDFRVMWHWSHEGVMVSATARGEVGIRVSLAGADLGADFRGNVFLKEGAHFFAKLLIFLRKITARGFGLSHVAPIPVKP